MEHLSKILLQLMEKIRQVFLPAHGHGGRNLSIPFHQPQSSPVLTDRTLHMIIILPQKAVQKHTVTCFIRPQTIKRLELFYIPGHYGLEIKLHKITSLYSYDCC